MPLYIKISSTLRQHVPGYDPCKGLVLDAVPGEKASDVAQRLGLPLKEIKFVMINGRYQGMDTPLNPDDRLAYFPAVGGG